MRLLFHGVGDQREDLSDDSGSKLHVKVVVPAESTAAQVDDVIRRVAAGERDAGELWVSVFLDGMDLNSPAYALGIARGGGPVAITRRQSPQTYR